MRYFSHSSMILQNVKNRSELLVWMNISIMIIHKELAKGFFTQKKQIEWYICPLRLVICYVVLFSSVIGPSRLLCMSIDPMLV